MPRQCCNNQYMEINVWYKEYKTSIGNTLATRRMTTIFLLILAMIADIWLDQVKFLLIITRKNLVKETCSMVTEFITILDPRGIFFCLL